MQMFQKIFKLPRYKIGAWFKSLNRNNPLKPIQRLSFPLIYLLFNSTRSFPKASTLTRVQRRGYANRPYSTDFDYVQNTHGDRIKIFYIRIKWEVRYLKFFGQERSIGSFQPSHIVVEFINNLNC